jgi:hypothetical protein
MFGSAAFMACGDDDSDGPSGGSGGMSGSAGNGNMAGSSGGGMGGSGGQGGSAGQGGTGGGGNTMAPAANCTGCVQLVLNVPATPTDAANMISQAGYQFSIADTTAPFDPAWDLSEVTQIVWKIQVQTPSANLFVQPILQNAPPEDANYAFGYYGAARTVLDATAFPAGMFIDVVLNVTAAGGGAGDAGAPPVVDAGDGGTPTITLTAFDKAYTRVVGLNFGATAAQAAGFAAIEISEVTVVGTSNFTTKTFETGVDGMILSTYLLPPGTLAPAAH